MEKLSGDEMAEILKIVGTEKFFEIKTSLQLKELTLKKIEQLKKDTKGISDLDFQMRKPVAEYANQKTLLEKLVSDASK